MRRLLVLAVFGLLLSACGGSDEPLASPGEQIQLYINANNITDEQTTSTGLVYLIEEPGSPERPSLDDEITIFYEGYLTDGTGFDRTDGSPRTFPLRALIQGWQEGIPLIGKGGKIKLLVPPELGYGNNPPRGTPIQPESVLVFDIELVDF